MDKETICMLRSTTLSKFSEHLKADEELAFEGTPSGFVNKSALDEFHATREEWKNAEAEWHAALKLYLFENRNN